VDGRRQALRELTREQGEERPDTAGNDVRGLAHRAPSAPAIEPEGTFDEREGDNE